MTAAYLLIALTIALVVAVGYTLSKLASVLKQWRLGHAPPVAIILKIGAPPTSAAVDSPKKLSSRAGRRRAQK